jgi:Leucine-rich repeat (LRR) protein
MVRFLAGFCNFTQLFVSFRDATEIGQHSDTPREAEVKVYSIFDLYETEGVRDIISPRGLYVRGSNVGPSFGDGGSGFYTSQASRWFVRGVTSSSFIGSKIGTNDNSLAVLTSVEKFTDWIYKILDRSGVLQCKIMNYQCFIQNLILSNNTEFVHIDRNGFGKLQDEDFQEVSLWNSSSTYLPIKLGTFFPNLTTYRIWNSEIKTISRANFEDLTKLNILEISNTPLKEIAKDSFYDLSELHTLDSHKNQIESLDRDTFINNPRLVFVYLNNNKLQSLDSSLFRNNVGIVILNVDNNLLTHVDHGIFTTLPKLLYFYLSNNTCTNVDFDENRTNESLLEIIKKDC